MEDYKKKCFVVINNSKKSLPIMARLAMNHCTFLLK